MPNTPNFYLPHFSLGVVLCFMINTPNLTCKHFNQFYKLASHIRFVIFLTSELSLSFKNINTNQFYLERKKPIKFIKCFKKIYISFGKEDISHQLYKIHF